MKGGRVLTVVPVVLGDAVAAVVGGPPWPMAWSGFLLSGAPFLLEGMAEHIPNTLAGGRAAAAASAQVPGRSLSRRLEGDEACDECRSISALPQDSAALG